MHIGYAVQWFAFALITLLIWLRLSLHKPVRAKPMLSQAESQTRQRNRRQLWLLIALFALPPIAAWLFYFNPQWLPTGRTNFGSLIEPPRAMQPIHPANPGRRPVRLARPCGTGGP